MRRDKSITIKYVKKKMTMKYMENDPNSVKENNVYRDDLSITYMKVSTWQTKIRKTTIKLALKSLKYYFHLIIYRL